MKAFAASIAICVLLVTSVITSADFPDQVYRFVELTDEEVPRIDLKDTSVDDWLEVVGEPSLWPLDFAAPPGSVHDPSSLDFRVWLAWHDETDRLYVAAEFIDDIHIDFFDPSSETFLGTCGEPNLQFFIDGDQGGGFVFEPDNHDGDYYPGRVAMCSGTGLARVCSAMASTSECSPTAKSRPGCICLLLPTVGLVGSARSRPSSQWSSTSLRSIFFPGRRTTSLKSIRGGFLRTAACDTGCAAYPVHRAPA